jgi:CheY-like chemotaxis protein
MNNNIINMNNNIINRNNSYNNIINSNNSNININSNINQDNNINNTINKDNINKTNNTNINLIQLSTSKNNFTRCKSIDTIIFDDKILHDSFCKMDYNYVIKNNLNSTLEPNRKTTNINRKITQNKLVNKYLPNNNDNNNKESLNSSQESKISEHNQSNSSINKSGGINNENIPKINKLKVLIIDDCNLLRRTVVTLFNKLEGFKDRYEIIEGADGIDILNIIKTDQKEGNKIVLIISDENMEYMTGSSAFSILRDLERNKKIKKIKKFSLTAFSDEVSLNDIKAKGCDKIYNKPINYNNVKEIYQDFLR